MLNFNKKDRLELIVSIALILVFWIVITFPPNPFSGLGFKNLIEHLFLGMFFAVLVSLISPQPILTKEEIHKYLHFTTFLRFILYILRLTLDIVMAGVDVAKRVLRPTILISPGIVEVETPLDDDILISLNANSITLTPGTITIDVEKNSNGSRFLVHCISKDAVEDIMKNKGFVKRLQDCFGIGER